MSKKIPFRISVLFVVSLLSVTACQGPGEQTPPSDTAVPQGAAPVDLPASRNDQAGDVNSQKNARQKAVAGGDVFINGLYERPFNAKTMDTYFPYLDIVDVQGFKDGTWGYATITLANADPNGGLPGQYAVELDLNKDGRGDWLIKASHVTSTQWSTQGVQAFKDTDGDIGDSVAMVADSKPLGGDGYETLVFNEGKGSLTDGAWARIKPDDPKTVEIAVKLSMLGNPASYAMGAFSGTNIDPALFDFNDHLSHPQAGSPNRGDKIYPLQDLAEMDNTCRLAIGFAANPGVPGLCATAQQQSEGGGGCSPRYSAAGLPCPPVLQAVPPGPVSVFPGP